MGEASGRRRWTGKGRMADGTGGEIDGGGSMVRFVGCREGLSERDPEKAPRSRSPGEGRRARDSDAHLCGNTAALPPLPGPRLAVLVRARPSRCCVHTHGHTHGHAQGPVTTSQATRKKEKGPREAGEAEPCSPLCSWGRCFLTPPPAGQGSKANTKHPSPSVQQNKKTPCTSFVLDPTA